MNKYSLRILSNILFKGRLLNLYGRFRKYVTDMVEGNPITFDINTDIGSSLFFSGQFEKKEIDLCGRFIKKDSLVLDIAANIGIHSIHFSRMAEEGLVISFEPLPETLSVLLRNVRNFANILPINYAGYNDCQFPLKHILIFS